MWAGSLRCAAGGKNSTLRGEFSPSPKCRQNVQTGWRMTQSDANRSLRPNSLIIREIQGIFAISAALRPIWDQISIVFSRVFVEIPYPTEQGIILEEQGFFRRNREFSGRSREIHLAGRAARKSFVFRVDGVLRKPQAPGRCPMSHMLHDVLPNGGRSLHGNRVLEKIGLRVLRPLTSC